MKKLAAALTCFASIAVCFALLAPANAAEEAPKSLEVTKKTKKLEVRHGQIGFRSTMLFYTFADQKAVLKVHIGNRDKTFPVTVTAYVFDKDVTADGIGKWLNNQHSDGLFPEVPEPIKTIKLPAKSGKVTAHKLTGETEQFNNIWDNYDVTVEVKTYAGEGVKINGFKAETKVHVKE